jgi:hypothetical protein
MVAVIVVALLAALAYGWLHVFSIFLKLRVPLADARPAGGARSPL